MWSAPNAWDKIKGADVVVNTNHVIFLTNNFLRLISLLTSTVFVSETSGKSYTFMFVFIMLLFNISADFGKLRLIGVALRHNIVKFGSVPVYFDLS